MTDEKDIVPVEQDALPTEYWGRDFIKGGKYDDEALRDIIEQIADTNTPVYKIIQNSGMHNNYFYTLQRKLPRFAEAVRIAKAMRADRLNDEILEIADKDFPVGAEKDEVTTEIAIRKMRMDARKHLSKETKVKGMETLSIDIGSKKDDAGENVTIVQINYGDKK